MDTNKTTSDKRDDIIQQAYKVFYLEGFHASGVDSLLEGTGISKRTLYKYFSTKEELIQATINYYAVNMQKNIFAYIEKHSGRTPTPAKKILLMFDWLEDHIASGTMMGCFAMNAKSEYANRHKDIEDTCDIYFSTMQNNLEDLCAENHCKDPKKTAHQILIIFQGAITNGQITRDPSSAQVAKAVVKSLLQSNI